MQPFQIVTGPAIPFRRPNTDTDVIIRIERLSELQRHELGPYAFEALRRRADQTDDPDCVFNRDVYKGAPILIAGENFGCGSSREGAVWAIAELGIRCIIAPSFGGIFANNCFQNGVLTIQLPDETVHRLAEIAEADARAPFTVDLAAKTLLPPNEAAIPFDIETLRQKALLAGTDELGMTLARVAELEAFELRDAVERPWVYLNDQMRRC